MMRVLKYFGEILFYGAVLGFLYPLFDFVKVLDAYKSPSHWITSFICSFVVYNAMIYFNKLNPRRFYYCFDVITTSLLTIVVTFLLFVGICFVCAIESLSVKILLFVIVAALYLLFIGVIFHRGVAVYKNGKVRVFNLKVKTYEAEKIDNVIFTYYGRKCTVNIIVCGEDNIFRISAMSARLGEERLKKSCQ